MKLRVIHFLLAIATVGVIPLRAAQINWGSPVDSVLRDSFGVPLDETFKIQLGFFESVLGQPFVPNVENVGEWALHWKVFDQAMPPDSYDPAEGYFTSSALLKADGSSSSPYASLGVDFSNQSAYIWIYNSNDPVEGSEWFLARSADVWNIPAKPVECCDNLPVLDWSVSDLEDGGDVPVFGKQGLIAGAGEYTITGNYTIQTFTFVPEPSTAALISLGALVWVLRRRRNPSCV